MYTNESHYYPGCHGDVAGGNPTNAFNIWAPRLRNLNNGGQKYFWCPAAEPSLQWKDNAMIGGAPIATAAHEGYGYHIGESVLQENSVQFSYGYNDWGACPVASNLGLGGDCWPGAAGEINPSKVKSAAEMIVITDVVAATPTASSWLSNVDPRDPTQCPAKIHSGGSNALFCDGHVDWMRQPDLILFDPGKGNAVVTVPVWNAVAKLWNSDNDPHVEFQ